MANPDTGWSELLRPSLRLMETAAEAVGIEIGPQRRAVDRLEAAQMPARSEDADAGA